jgi:hypothetical protein
VLSSVFPDKDINLPMRKEATATMTALVYFYTYSKIAFIAVTVHYTFT